MEKQSVSIIIPTFNRADLIMRALDSVFREIAPGDEIIVVDDGSTDNTEKVLSPCKEKIRYFKIPNSGAGAARNFGIRKSGNPLLAFLDSDDEWMPGKLAMQKAFMQARPDVLFCFTDFAVTFKDGRETRNFLVNWHEDLRSWNEILGPGKLYSSICPLPQEIGDFNFHVGDLYHSMLKNSYVNTGTAMVRRKEAGDALCFAEDLPWGEDWVYYSNLAKKGSAAYLDCETAWQHGHSGQRLTDTGILNGITYRISIMERVWGSDDNFLKTNGPIYRQLLRNQRILRTRELIAQGYTAEARKEMRKITSPPLGYRLLASLPGVLVRALLTTRRTILSKLRPS